MRVELTLMISNRVFNLTTESIDKIYSLTVTTVLEAFLRALEN